MKKICFLNLLFFIFWPICTVMAIDLGSPNKSSITGLNYYWNIDSKGSNQGAGVCSTSNSYYNPTQLVDIGYKDTASKGIVYDITYIDIQDDKLSIYGWAFNKGVDNDLGGKSNSNSADNTSVTFVIAKSEGTIEANTPYIFDIAYADPSMTDAASLSSGLHYYDLTYWNCTRTSRDKYKDYNGNISGGMCISSATHTLQGGFKATLDLSKEIPDGTYTIFMKVDSPSNTSEDAKWQAIAASTLVASDNINNYNNSSTSITISGLSNQAKVVASNGRLMGSNGLFCSSPASEANKSKTYYKTGVSYTVLGRETLACRGNCNNYAYYQSLYKLQTSSLSGGGTVTNGSGWEAYAPATWLQFDGKITITIGNTENEAPNVCEGKEIYNNYYLFLATVNDNTTQMRNSAKSSKYNDSLIFKQLGIDSLSNISYTSSVYPITAANIEEFYTWLKKATSTSDRYYREGNDFYIAHMSYCSVDESNNETVCFDTATGCKLDEDGNVTSDCTHGNLDATNGKLDIKTYVNATVPATSININKQANESNNGFQFSVSRTFNAFPNGRYKLTDIKSKAIKINNQYLNPAVYQITYCLSDEPVCEDDVVSAVCESDDTGTNVVFHENDDLKTCTLPKGTSSGFTIVETSETQNASGKSYCEVACKENIDIELPGEKEAAAGQYFVLDNYIPKISANRTCVTSEIDYSSFDEDLKSYEDEDNLPRKYNNYQDYLDIYQTLSGEITASGPETCTYQEADGTMIVDGVKVTKYVTKTDTYDWENWIIYDHDAINYSSNDYGGETGHYVSPNKCGITGDESYESAFSRTKSEYKSLTQSAKNIYESTLKDYQKTINAYNTCFSWTDVTSNAKLSGGGGLSSTYKLSVASSTVRNNYRYTFEPTVTFDYPDRDGKIFPVAYTYDYDKDVDKDGFNITNNYWQEGASIDNSYTTGGTKTNGEQAKGLNSNSRMLLSCSGTTCGSPSVSSYFYTSSYLRRDESVTYTYHLPKVYTNVPDGTVTTSKVSGKTQLELENEAVPININTIGGTYDYYISVTDLKDDLRKSKENKNPDDNFEERFIGTSGSGGALNAGEQYVCQYNVINDVYLPEEKEFNFFYRTVDLRNVNPNNRTLGYNWSDAKAQTVIERMKESVDYQVLTKSEDRDKFSFTLTPVIMKQIRKYNSNRINGYADWDLACYDYNDSKNGYHCYSTFLTCLASGGQINSPGDGTSCSNIFDNVLEGYNKIQDYDKSELDKNRDILINKMNSLDGR